MAEPPWDIGLLNIYEFATKPIISLLPKTKSKLPEGCRALLAKAPPCTYQIILFYGQMLLQFGGSLHAVDSEGLTPAMWACYFDQLHNLQVLHDALCRLDPQEDAIFKDTDCYGQSVIHWSVKGAGSLECLEVFDKEMMRDEMVFAWHVFKNVIRMW